MKYVERVVSVGILEQMYASRTPNDENDINASRVSFGTEGSNTLLGFQLSILVTTSHTYACTVEGDNYKM